MQAATEGATAPAISAKGEAEPQQPLLSVVIKALNEEEKIGSCLASVLDATGAYPTQVIVADSRSDDATIAIASRFGVNVVSLAPDEERGCGVGAQLGFQHATGKYVLVMDGDMLLDPGFLPEALRVLEEDEGLAGVGGMVELDQANLEYRLRRERGKPHLRPGFVDRLDGGGLYRRAAIRSVGYLTDRNLHSYEELELALRLRQRGWRLKRIAATSVHHRGHATPAFALLLRRWRTRYTDGQGEALRAALGSGRERALLRESRLSLAVIGWWGCLALLLALALSGMVGVLPFLVLLVLPVAIMAVKRRSLAAACYSVALWQLNAAGLVRGLLRPQRDPMRPIGAGVANTASAFPVRSDAAAGALKQPAPAALG